MLGHLVENLSFSSIRATFPGDGTAEDATYTVADFTPENLAGRWPEIGNLRATVLAYGLFAHHIKGITLHNIEFKTKAPDACPAMVFSDMTDPKTEKPAN